ncbi:MAG: hypothetical protein FJZ38_24030 [Candidatus Rokubacteria bacterium]|nr:hypothetical protein [Candidatus Rokubacteria bacterium]
MSENRVRACNFGKRVLVRACAVSAIVVLLAAPALARSDVSPELRQAIVAAGMSPWTWQPISLDDPLRRGLNNEKVPLRQFVTGDKPLIVYMYGYW